MYVPEVGLLSVRKVTNNGFRVIFEKGKCSFYDNNDDVIAYASCISDGDLLRLCTVNNTFSVQIASSSENSQQWHRRLGHRDPTAIKQLVN